MITRLDHFVIDLRDPDEARQVGLAVTSSSVALPNCPIEIVRTEDDDERLVEVKLRVQNLAATGDWLSPLNAGIPLNDRVAERPERSLGAQLVFVA